MARRGGFRPQAPKKVTLIIAVILWVIGLLLGLNVIHLPSNGVAIEFWSLVIAGLLLILGCLVDGV
ncbi:MAG TPA: hypothetical protein VGS07_31690 [Thermoanaerobaculia bacterium]|jgi:hypothetical protein|nr:hypothetical protein [Thermoanaerobaculia bacterium]